MNGFSRRTFFVALFFICSMYFSMPARSATADDLDGLIANLHAHDLSTQLGAVEELGRLSDDRAVQAFLDFVFIKAENWRVKIKVIGVLGDIPDPMVSDKLVTLFNDPFLNEECPAMKWYTATALGKDFNKGSRAVDVLIEAADYDNLLVREAVIRSLGKIGDSRAVPVLIPALADPSFAIKFSAIKALENIGDPQAIPFLRQSADADKDDHIREAALSALRNFKSD